MITVIKENVWAAKRYEAWRDGKHHQLISPNQKLYLI